MKHLKTISTLFSLPEFILSFCRRRKGWGWAKILLLIVNCSLLINNGIGQNLVPNPSFEDTAHCPISDSDMDAVNNWVYGTIPSSDYFNSCEPSNWASVPQNFIGYQFARTGNGYCGFYAYSPFMAPDTSYREYIETRLTDTLTSGEIYRLDFYVSLSDSSNYANGIGAYLSNDSVSSGSMTNLSFIPQIETTFNSPITDKNLWVKVSGTYTANGGEKYLTIGNFKTNSSTDTVSVANGGSISNVDNQGAYYYIDDVYLYKDTLTSIEENNDIPNINVFPNPSLDGKITILLDIDKEYKIDVLNMVGQIVPVKIQEHIAKQTIQLSKGSYIIRFSNTNKLIYKKILILN